MDDIRQALYFVGAGLTKSLEVQGGLRVPLMNDFVAVMSDYLDNPIVRTSIRTLEMAKLFEYSTPDWIELATRNLARDPGKKKLNEYRAILKSRPSENIEALLRRDQSLSPNIHTGGAPLRFNFAINAVFSSIGWKLDMAPLESFVRRQIARDFSKHTFVTFNYDLALDRAVQIASDKSWSLNTGYGFRVNYYLDTKIAKQHMRQFEGTGGSFLPLDKKALLPGNAPPANPILVLKPHGSLNWLLPFEENYRFVEDTPTLLLKESLEISYYPTFDVKHVKPAGEEIPWPTWGLYIIPPVEEKTASFEFLRAIRKAQQEAIMSGDQVFIIGWSMPETDQDEVSLIESCTRARKKPFDRVIAINYGQTLDYYRRVAETFGINLSDMEIHNEGFNEYVKKELRKAP